MPCDTAAAILRRSIDDQLHRLLDAAGRSLDKAEARLGVTRRVGDIREVGVGRKHEVDLLDAGVVPRILDRICRSELLDRSHVVVAVAEVVLRLVARILVDVNLTVDRIVGVLAIDRKGQSVVVETPIGLLAGLGRPPVQTVRTGRAASEVAVDGRIPHPLLRAAVRQSLHVGLRIERIAIVVIHSEFHHLRAHRNAVDVVGFQLHLMHAGLAYAELDAVLGIGVLLGGFAVDLLLAEDPHGHHALVVDR